MTWSYSKWITEIYMTQRLTDNIKCHYHNLFDLGLQCLTHYEYCQHNLALETYEWDNTLTFKQLSWYLNIIAYLRKTWVFFEQKKIKLWYEWYFVENETQITQILKMQSISLLLEHIKWAYKGVFTCICICEHRSFKS